MARNMLWVSVMNEEDFKKLWTREAGNQPGMILDVLSVEELSLSETSNAA